MNYYFFFCQLCQNAVLSSLKCPWTTQKETRIHDAQPCEGQRKRRASSCHSWPDILLVSWRLCALPLGRLQFALWVVAVDLTLVTGDDPRRDFDTGFEVRGVIATWHRSPCWLLNVTWNLDAWQWVFTLAACTLSGRALFAQQAQSLNLSIYHFSVWQHQKIKVHQEQKCTMSTSDVRSYFKLLHLLHFW